MSEEGKLSPKISMIAYRPGDEDRIVDFLNFSYPGGWGDIEQWKWRYVNYPTFEKDSIFILEADGKIVGYRGLFFRDVLIPSIGNVRTVSFGGTAVHPDFRGFGIYSRMHQATLETGRSKNASLVFTWNGRGTVTYKHNKKTGFAEVRRGAYYVKILNHERLFISHFKDFIIDSENIMNLLNGLKDHLYLGVGNSVFSVAQILGEAPDSTKPKKRVEVVFTETAFPLMLKFKLGGKVQKVMSMFLLLVSRRMKIRFTSFGILLKLAWKGVRVIV